MDHWSQVCHKFSNLLYMYNLSFLFGLTFVSFDLRYFWHLQKNFEILLVLFNFCWSDLSFLYPTKNLPKLTVLCIWWYIPNLMFWCTLLFWCTLQSFILITSILLFRVLVNFNYLWYRLMPHISSSLIIYN